VKFALAVALAVLLALPAHAGAHARLTPKRAHAKAAMVMPLLTLLYGTPAPAVTIGACKVRSRKHAACPVTLRTSWAECREKITIVVYRGALRWRYPDDPLASPCSAVAAATGILPPEFDRQWP